MLMEQIAMHLKQEYDEVSIPAFDRMRVQLRGRGDVHIMDNGYNGNPSRVFAVAFSLTEREMLGRLYLPLWYTPRMNAYYIDAVLQCASHRETSSAKRGQSKLDAMLNGFNPQERYDAALDRLADMSYIDGFECMYAPGSNSVLWGSTKTNSWQIDATPMTDYTLRFSVVREYGVPAAREHVMPYPYELDDIVAYMNTVRVLVEQYKP